MLSRESDSKSGTQTLFKGGFVETFSRKFLRNFMVSGHNESTNFLGNNFLEVRGKFIENPSNVPLDFSQNILL